MWRPVVIVLAGIGIADVLLGAWLGVLYVRDRWRRRRAVHEQPAQGPTVAVRFTCDQCGPVAVIVPVPDGTSPLGLARDMRTLRDLSLQGRVCHDIDLHLHELGAAS